MVGLEPTRFPTRPCGKSFAQVCCFAPHRNGTQSLTFPFIPKISLRCYFREPFCLRGKILFLQNKRLSLRKVFLLVRMVGLEPTRFPTRPLNVRVYQFRHIRICYSCFTYYQGKLFCNRSFYESTDIITNCF